jgi:hypothetical protein
MSKRKKAYVITDRSFVLLARRARGRAAFRAVALRIPRRGRHFVFARGELLGFLYVTWRLHSACMDHEQTKQDTSNIDR